MSNLKSFFFLSKSSRSLTLEYRDSESAATAENDHSNTSASKGPLKPIGKNYNAELRGPQSGFQEPPTLRLGINETVELASAELERETLAKLKERGISAGASSAKQGLDLESLQPKRANWDLKRDIEPQLKQLEAQTQNAIVRIVRERLKSDVKEYK